MGTAEQVGCGYFRVIVAWVSQSKWGVGIAEHLGKLIGTIQNKVKPHFVNNLWLSVQSLLAIAFA